MDSDIDQNNYCFLFLLSPFNPSFQTFPVHLYQAISGNANDSTKNIINQIICISKKN